MLQSFNGSLMPESISIVLFLYTTNFSFAFSKTEVVLPYYVISPSGLPKTPGRFCSLNSAFPLYGTYLRL